MGGVGGEGWGRKVTSNRGHWDNDAMSLFEVGEGVFGKIDALHEVDVEGLSNKSERVLNLCEGYHIALGSVQYEDIQFAKFLDRVFHQITVQSIVRTSSAANQTRSYPH